MNDTYEWHAGLEQLAHHDRYGRLAYDANEQIRTLTAERDRLQAALKATTDPASSWNLANNKETLKLRLEHFVHTTLNTTAGAPGH